MIWFNEAKDFGFILTEEGERLYVHRSDFLPGEIPIGRCAHLPVRFEVSVRGDKRVAIEVSKASKEPPPRARRRGSSVRSVSH